MPLPEYCPNQDESKGLIDIIGLSAINSLGIALDRRTYSKNPVSDEDRLQLKTARLAYSHWRAIWATTHTLHDAMGRNLDLARDVCTVRSRVLKSEAPFSFATALHSALGNNHVSLPSS